MQVWKWFGTWAVSLIAQPAGAQPTPASPPESAASANRAPVLETRAPEPVVHDVAPQQQPEPPNQTVNTPASLPPTSQETEVTRWYGDKTLMADGLALSVALAGAISGDNGEPLYWIAGGGYLFGAPIVHQAHGNTGRAAASLGLRVALPIAFLGVGSSLEDCRGQDFCGMSSLVIGVPLGMAAAIALDAALLARDTVHRPPALVPTAAAGSNGGSLGLGGTF